MKKLLTFIVLAVGLFFIGSGSLNISFSPTPERAFGATAAIPTPIALFETSLASGITDTDTSMTLQFATDKDGNTLSGTYAFIIDEGTSTEEFVNADCTGTSCTNMTRGLSVVTGTTSITANKYRHRRGASVKITDAPQLLILHRIINGISTFPNKLVYTSEPSFTADEDIVSKGYVDGVAIAGAPDASTSTKGIGKTSVAPASATNPIFVGDNDPRVPTTDENDALVGTSGSPSTSNKYVTNDDTATAATADKVARRGSTGGITVPDTPNTSDEAINQDYGDANYALVKETYTADGNISQYDMTYPTGNDTVARFQSDQQDSGTAISTNAGHQQNIKTFPMGATGKYLHLSGGTVAQALALYAQVRTINAAETDFSNGSESTVFASDEVYAFDAADISSAGDGSKFMLIYQKRTTSSPAGIVARVMTISGTTITLGSESTIESTGSSDAMNAVVKLDTDKAMIAYRDDSGGDIYVQVLSVSGTSITTNTPVLVKAVSSAVRLEMTDLATDSAVLLYSSNSNIFGVTIDVSGTTPTVNSEQTVVASSATWTINVAKISSTKILYSYVESSSTRSFNLAAISGSTITPSGTPIATGANSTPDGHYTGMYVISEARAFFGIYTTGTNIKLWYLDISGTTPTSLQTRDLSGTTTSGTSDSVGIVKVLPWVYQVTGGATDSDYIVDLNVPSLARTGIASANITDSSTGDILYRFKVHGSLTGFAAGTTYYVDDDGQPTSTQSLLSPLYGHGLSTTKVILE